MTTTPAPDTSRLARLWQYLETDPGNTSLLRDVAREAFGTGQFEEALKALDLLRDQGAHDAGDEAAALHALSKLARWPQATERAEEALAQWPADEAVRVEAARVWLNTGRLPEVVNLCEGAFEEPALAQMAGEMLLQALWHQGELGTAVARSTELVARFPQNPRLLALHSALLYDEERMPEAFDAAKRAYAMAPAHAYQALHVLASERLMQQDVAGATQWLERAQATTQGDGRVWLLKGAAAMLSGNESQALTALNQAAVLFPKHPGTHLTLAWLHLVRQDLDQAEQCVDQAIAASPAFAESHGVQALILLQRGRKEEAERAVRRALLLDKECYSARYARGLMEQGREGNLQELVAELASKLLKF